MCFLEVQPQMIFPNEITCKDTECLLGESNEIKCFLRYQNLTTKLMINKTCVFNWSVKKHCCLKYPIQGKLIRENISIFGKIP